MGQSHQHISSSRKHHTTEPQGEGAYSAATEPHPSLAPPPTQGLCPALLGTHRSEAQGSHVLTGPSFHTHISVPLLLRPSERRRLYLIQPQSAWPQLRAQEPHTPRDGNLTSGPNLPVTKSSSCEKQRRPLRPSPGTQVQRASNFAS